MAMKSNTVRTAGTAKAPPRKSTTLSKAFATQRASISDPSELKNRAFTYHGAGNSGPTPNLAQATTAPARKILKESMTQIPRLTSGMSRGSLVGFADPGGPRGNTMGRVVTARTGSPDRERAGSAGPKATTQRSGSMRGSPRADLASGTTASRAGSPLRSRTGASMAKSKTESDLATAPLPFPAHGLRDRRAPAPAALGPKNSWKPPEGGRSERMEATKWTRWTHMVDQATIGAHYSYIVGELGAARALEDEEKKDHDLLLADTLHKRRPSDLPHPRAAEPRLPMSAAFTDRSLRMREGRGTRKALMSEETPATEWGEHGECSCTVCRPHEAQPAGQPSHEVHYNKVPRCGKNSQPNFEFSHTFNSAKMDTTLTHMTEKLEVLPQAEEISFEKCMGRKARGPSPSSPGGGKMMKHRSMSADDISAAGNYNQENMAFISTQRSKARQAWQGGREDDPPRSGVALVLSPRDGDPPAPTQITYARKADGTFKVGPSGQAQYFSQYFNQEMFRYSDPRSGRGRSVPPMFPSDAAGQPTGERANHLFTAGNPLTMEGKDNYPFALGNTHRPSPQGSFRHSFGNSSRVMGRIINHEEGERASALEASRRFEGDRTFRELCAATLQSSEAVQKLAAEIKHGNGHARSDGVASNLVWIE